MKTFVIRGLAAMVRLTAAVRRAARRLGRAVAEFNNQQSRLTTMRFSQDAYMNRPGAAPDTYAEFLFRTRGPLRHEPSLRARLDGHPVH
jgi:hypothetical protein